MTTVALDVEAVRARFSALQVPTAFLDGPGGTQCPDSVVDAIAGYLRESNANVGGSFGSSRRSDALLARARLAASAFLRCEPDEAIFGQNMTTLNFMLSRTVGRTLAAGDEIQIVHWERERPVDEAALMHLRPNLMPPRRSGSGRTTRSTSSRTCSLPTACGW